MTFLYIFQGHQQSKDSHHNAICIDVDIGGDATPFDPEEERTSSHEDW